MEETVDFLKYLATYDAQVKQIEVVIPANLTCASAWESVYPNVNVGAFMNALSYGRSYLSTVNATWPAPHIRMCWPVCATATLPTPRSSALPPRRL